MTLAKRSIERTALFFVVVVFSACVQSNSCSGLFSFNAEVGVSILDSSGSESGCLGLSARATSVPGRQLVLLLARPGPGEGGEVVDGPHAVDGGVQLLQLLADVVQLLRVGSQVAGVCLAGLAPPLLA